MNFCATQKSHRPTEFLPCIGAGQEQAGGVGPSAIPAGFFVCSANAKGASPPLVLPWGYLCFGVKGILPENIGLIRGRGCPLCVLATGRIDDGLAITD